MSYEYIDEPPACMGYDEVEAHKVKVELNEIGKAFLTLEDHYANGAEIIEPEELEPELEYDADAEEYYRWMAEEEAKEREGKGDAPIVDKDPPF